MTKKECNHSPQGSFVLKGDICYSKSLTELACAENAFLVCENGRSAGVFRELPEAYRAFPLTDYSGMLIIPGMVDLHIHAPQYTYRGLGMDLELLDWLQTYAFPEEAKYASLEYADKAYGFFADRLKNSATTRAIVFATVHPDATVLLMEKLEKAGLVSYVGKVNMDCDAPDNLREPSAEASLRATRDWLKKCAGRFGRTSPILTPRFLPSCSKELLSGLQRVREEYRLPVQSHLSENQGEIELVGRLFPEAAFYGDGYDRYGLFGGDAKTVMAHCVYSSPEEITRMKKNGVFIAHCPASNTNIASGIAPIRRYLEEGLRVGLGSDVAGGESESIFRAIADAVKVSKLNWRLVDDGAKPLSFEEAFYLATVGGGEFFGKVGSFESGYEFDAVVLDDRGLGVRTDLSVRQRAERDVYLEADRDAIRAKYAGGIRCGAE